MRKNKKFSSSRYNYRKGDYLGMNEYLKKINWDELLTGIEVRGQYSILLREYNTVCEKYLKKLEIWMGERRDRLG